MAKFKFVDEHDLKIFFKNVKNLAIGEIIPMEWQWLPKELAVRVRVDGKNWILVNDDGYKCTDKAMAYNLACWYVWDLPKEKAREIFEMQRDEV